VIIYAWMDRRRENSEAAGTRLWGRTSRICGWSENEIFMIYAMSFTILDC
jgi:hypothetical protein